MLLAGRERVVQEADRDLDVGRIALGAARSALGALGEGESEWEGEDELTIHSLPRKPDLDRLRRIDWHPPRPH